MLRSVMTEGTASAVKGGPNPIAVDVAGKTGTTNDQRDAWFVGFTPELLTVVWVGFDNNQPIGLTGSQAALPVWLSFTRRALAAHPNVPFVAPDGLVSVEIDKETGGLATPDCPKTMVETFLPGTEPHERCPLHGGTVVGSTVNRLSSWLKRIIK
jgi:membrane carboxypeptidase/penicillin-binding protein